MSQNSRIKMTDVPTLSFCITCKNRFKQISQTLQRNLEDNKLHQKYIEFVLVDFSSSDGLREWILKDFQQELSTGYLRYYYTEALPYWHASIAKNTAHWCARNDIVVNLDCDNFTGYLGGKFVIEHFYKYRMDIVFHQYSGDVTDGTYGRIAALRKYFHLLGGYNESFEPMSFQDNDLIERMKLFGLNYILKRDKEYNRAIVNTKEEGLVNTDSSNDYRSMFLSNMKLSERLLSEGTLIANNGYYGIRHHLTDHRNYLFEKS